MQWGKFHRDIMKKFLSVGEWWSTVTAYPEDWKHCSWRFPAFSWAKPLTTWSSFQGGLSFEWEVRLGELHTLLQLFFFFYDSTNIGIISKAEVTVWPGGLLLPWQIIDIRLLAYILLFTSMGFVVDVVSADYFSYVRVLTWAPIYRPTGTNRIYSFIFSVHISWTILIFL